MSALAASLNPSAVVMGFDQCLFGSFSAFNTFSVSERQRIYKSSNDLPAGKELVMVPYLRFLNAARSISKCANFYGLARSYLAGAIALAVLAPTHRSFASTSW